MSGDTSGRWLWLLPILFVLGCVAEIAIEGALK
jgi:hypothetical protein